MTDITCSNLTHTLDIKSWLDGVGIFRADYPLLGEKTWVGYAPYTVFDRLNREALFSADGRIFQFLEFPGFFVVSRRDGGVYVFGVMYSEDGPEYERAGLIQWGPLACIRPK